jgi:hypothetical protein
MWRLTVNALVLVLFSFSFSDGFWLLFSVLLICGGMCYLLSLSVHSRVSILVAWTHTLCHISAQLQSTKWKLSDPFALSTSPHRGYFNLFWATYQHWESRGHCFSHVFNAYSLSTSRILVLRSEMAAIGGVNPTDGSHSCS